MAKKYYLPIVIVFLIIAISFTLFFAAVQRDTKHAMLEEKAMERQTNLDIICSQIDKFIELDNDWQTYDYEPIIAHSMECLDNLEMTFAAVYNGRMQEISNRAPSYRNVPFEPLSHKEFIEAIYKAESGMIDLWFENKEGGVTGRTMKTAWRWIPTDTSIENRYLTVVAVSEYSIKNEGFNWMWIGTGAVMLIMGGTCLLFVRLFSKARE